MGIQIGFDLGAARIDDFNCIFLNHSKGVFGSTGHLEIPRLVNLRRIGKQTAFSQGLIRLIMLNRPQTRPSGKGGYGGLVGMEVNGGMTADQSFIDHLKLLYHVANIGDARSLAIHPGSTTHSQVNDEELLRSGVTRGLRAALDRYRAHR